MTDTSSPGLRFPRRFTTAGGDPFESFTFVEREAIVRDFKTGEVKFQLRVEVPDDWEQGAVDVLASKYCRKAGVPQGSDQLIPDLGPERSAKQVVSRMANAWMLWGQRGSYFASEEDAEAFRDEIAYMIMNQMGAPNSPQWFNTGLFEAYGIVEDADGNSYFDPQLGKVVTSAHKYERATANACFILSVKDELVGPGSIMNLIEREARLFKGGSGAGSNVSAIRAKHEKLTGGGTSSGVMSFLRPIDRAAGAIKSGGTTRRAAKMVILNLDHPEIEDFIWCKVEQEKVVAALIAAGFDSGWDTPGGAYDRAEFQNANHSVRIPSGFLQKLIDDGDIELIGRKDGAVLGRRKARELWNAIAEASWICADPGVQFDGLINDWATTPNDGRINGSNPCFTGDTLVHTDRGLIRFDAMVHRSAAGETFGVYTHDATSADDPTHRITLSSPEAVMITGMNEIVRLEFSNGMVLRCTPAHRVWTTNRGWVEAAQLSADDAVLALDLPTPADMASSEFRLRSDCPVQPGSVVRSRYMAKTVDTTIPEKWSSELAHMIGWLVGDGSLSAAKPGPGNNATISLVYGSGDEAAAMSPAHEATLRSMVGDGASTVQLPNGTIQLRANRKPLNDFLVGLGVSTSRSPRKVIPEAVLEAPVDCQAAFLRGLFDSDGCVVDAPNGTRYVGLGSASQELLRGAQRLLSCFGIGSRIYKTKDAGKSGFTYTKKDGTHPVYDSSAMFDLRISGKNVTLFASKIGFAHPTKSATLERVVQSSSFYKTDQTVQMVACESDGVEVTYNLSEPRNHSYVANGVVVRNCSEYLHVDDTACNLASLNLAKFFDADSQVFDAPAFEHAVRVWTTALEITVAMSHYPSPEIAFNSFEHRTLGLGFANLGALLMRAGLPYDSREGRAVMGAVTALMTARAYATSAEMAAAVGPCAAYERNVEPMQRVLRNHRRAAYGSERARYELGGYESLEVEPVDIDHRILARTVFSNLTDPVKAAADDMVAMVGAHGARNAQATVIAPTGTIGLVMSCDTTGPEPDFALVKWKKLAGGGMMKIVNRSVEPALRALGYDEATIAGVITHALGTASLNSAAPVNHQKLVEAGVDEMLLAAVEASLPTTPNLAMAFSAFVVGDPVFVEHGLDPQSASGAELLAALGFTAEDIVSSSLVICGHETIEGAPGLRDEDLPVFDTANYCGDGQRVISWRGHVEALGAIQPHVSGGISKTINVPNDATVDDVREAHELAYELGVKCVAVYRDGSKLSQPLNRNLDDAEKAEAAGVTLVAAHPEIVPGMSPGEYYGTDNPPRFRLPSVRDAKTFSLNVGGMDVYITTGEFNDGTLGELWISLSKDGSTLRGAFSNLALAVSLGLQRGVPLSQYVEKFTGQVFEPKGIVQGSDHLKMATSVPDAIFRLLGFWYLGRDDLVQAPNAGPRRPGAKPSTTLEDRSASGPPHEAQKATIAVAMDMGSPYTGDLCPNCSSPRMIRSGTCAKCDDCGSTTGCS